MDLDRKYTEALLVAGDQLRRIREILTARVEKTPTWPGLGDLNHVNELLAEIVRFLDGPTPDDLITIREAAIIRGVSTQAIGAAIDDGRLRPFYNPRAPSRQGRRLVSMSEVVEM